MQIQNFTYTPSGSDETVLIRDMDTGKDISPVSIFKKREWYQLAMRLHQYDYQQERLVVNPRFSFDDFFQEVCGDSKEDYLRFRDMIKVLLRSLSDHQRQIKPNLRSSKSYVRSDTQTQRYVARCNLRDLHRLRIEGKKWSYKKKIEIQQAA